ncbi:MAG TPA: DUF6703 family protein [Micromonosporaceae bacterium]|nr:DUF6703 family protein [Micromonosporaceae bacterium]
MQRTQNVLLARLARVNPTAAFLGALALVLIGLFAPGIIGGALLLALAVGLAVLLVATWPVQAPQTRAARLVMLSLLVAVALVKIL